ncbi:MAG: multiheme c-type cytochrome [Halofilum sp. (in: g-proteobacteria)]|nr:multiheme c-type cytochrome [Halofilum sp. (in: g-proteobacteria)]
MMTRALLFCLLLGTGGAMAAEDATDTGMEEDPHAEVYSENAYPSAAQCGSCHPRVFAEWSSSSHAYASISPMFHKFEQAITNLTQGTIGTFCVRCHQQVGTQMGEPREQALWERSRVAREGVTCITCHRVKNAFGKVNGERHIEPGPITDPVYGGGTSKAEDYANVLSQPERYNIETADNPDGQQIHSAPIEFKQLEKSEFCVSCHQVAVNLGIKLEVVWDQYRGSPAEQHGITCQDCHMGEVPGKAEGYATGPVAIVNGRPVGEGSKHANHAFYGPGYPIAHPGIFPFNRRALEWSIKEWLKFDYRAGWGTPEFERRLARGEIERPDFPEPWNDRETRERANVIVQQNKRGIEYKRETRRQVMENGSRIDGPFFAEDPQVGEDLEFHYTLTNTDEGHNLPSGSLGAQPEIWFNVALIGPDGENLWESGYVDSHGDMADLHSHDVQQGKIEHDDQLVNLQSKFLTTNVKGTDREMYLPVTFDVDQIPFLRPAAQPTTVINHPPFVRMEQRSLPPLGSRDAEYTIPGELIDEPGTYKLQARLRSRAEPIYFMKFVGATTDMEQAMNEWMLDIHPYAVEFEVR